MQNLYIFQHNSRKEDKVIFKPITFMTYTFLVQDNVSKQTFSWILEDLTPESIYHKFEIELKDDMDNSEYQWILFKNPNRLEIQIAQNDIFKSLLIGGETEIESFGLVKIGPKKPVTQYNKEESYVVYK